MPDIELLNLVKRINSENWIKHCETSPCVTILHHWIYSSPLTLVLFFFRHYSENYIQNFQLKLWKLLSSSLFVIYWPCRKQFLLPSQYHHAMQSEPSPLTLSHFTQSTILLFVEILFTFFLLYIFVFFNDFCSIFFLFFYCCSIYTNEIKN